MYNIFYRNEVPDELVALCEQEQIKYESKHNVKCNYTPFYFTTEIDGNIAAMLSGYTCYSEIYIVVIDIYRNNGIGSNLIKKLDEHFKGLGIPICCNPVI